MSVNFRINLWSHHYSKIWTKYCMDFWPVVWQILTIFDSSFGRNDDFINSFWNLLTFRRLRKKWGRGNNNKLSLSVSDLFSNPENLGNMVSIRKKMGRGSFVCPFTISSVMKFVWRWVIIRTIFCEYLCWLWPKI